MPVWRVRDEVVGQLFGGLRGEEAGMRVFERVELRAHGGENVGMRMAEAGHRGAAGGVDVVLAGRVADEDALARHGRRIVVGDGAVQDVSHFRLRPLARGRT